MVIKDLIELDASRVNISLLNETIKHTESKVKLQDSIISTYKANESDFKDIINDKNMQINGLDHLISDLNNELKTIKKRGVFHRIGSYIVIGGLTYLLLTK